jgi:phospholipid transport system substrate-binding protein
MMRLKTTTGSRRAKGHVLGGLALIGALLFILGCGTQRGPQPGEIPEDAAAAVEVVQRFQAVLIDVMKNAESLGYTGRSSTLAPVARACIDIRLMARRTLGAEWAKLDASQQQLWLRTFERFHVSAVADLRDAYRDQAFVILGAAKQTDGRVRVHSQLDYPGRQVDLFTDYLVHETRRGWLIVDVFKPPTVSEVAMRRSEYESTLRSEGFDKLLKAMEQRIARNELP